MSNRSSNSPQRRFCRPSLEGLEERCLLDATPNIFAIASSVYQGAALLGQIQANLPALARNPQIAPAVAQVAETIAARSQQDVAQLQIFEQQVQQAANAQIAGLEQLFSQVKSDTIRDFNQQVLDIQNNVAALPPAQQQAVAQAVANYEFRLADGAVTRVKAVRDFVNGQETAVVEFVSKLNSFAVPLVGRATQNEIIATQLEQVTGGVTPTPVPAPTGALITGHSPFHELDIVPAGSDPRFPDSIITVGEYNQLIQSGQPVPNVADRSPNEF